MRLDVFNAKAAAEKNIRASGQWDALSSEEKRLVEKSVSHGLKSSTSGSDVTLLGSGWHESRPGFTREGS